MDAYNAQFQTTLDEATLAMRRLAALIWNRQQHEPGEWAPVHDPFLGWTMRCSSCGEACVVQFLTPNLPLAVGLVINMLPGKCGDRVYVPPRDEVELEVWA
jgi:hypothetical protein